MGNSVDWQTMLYEEFCSKDGRYILFNPRQEHWDASSPGEMDYQVNWELDLLEDAGMRSCAICRWHVDFRTFIAIFRQTYFY